MTQERSAIGWLSIIVALDEDGLIGRDNDLPWRLPADLRRFKRLTTGHSLIMGRKTFESIGKPLPGRTSIVISRSTTEPEVEDAASSTRLRWARSPDEAIEIAAESPGSDEVFVAGGAQIYGLLLERADRLYLTRVRERFSGDTRFPELDWSQWRTVSREDYPADEQNPHPYSFCTYRREAVP